MLSNLIFRILNIFLEVSAQGDLYSIKTVMNIQSSPYFYTTHIFQYAALKLKVEAVQILLEAGGDPNTLDGAGRTPMTNVIRQCVRADGTIRTDDCLTIVLMLLHAGSDVNMTTCEECCPLMVASILRCPTLVKFFLDHGANPGIRCKSDMHFFMIKPF